MSKYTIHAGDEFGGDCCYQVLKGPDGFEVWLTEPEDRNFYRDLDPVVKRLEQLDAALPPAMTWTTTKPTKPGWYWYRDPYGCSPVEARANATMDGHWLVVRGGMRHPMTAFNGDWAGPLEPPQ